MQLNNYPSLRPIADMFSPTEVDPNAPVAVPEELGSAAPAVAPPADAPTAEPALNAAPSVEAPSAAPAASSLIAEVPPPVDASVEVSAVLQEWAAAWSAKDVAAYLANYTPEFTSADGKSRPAWDEQRKQRIASKNSISVNLSDIKITVNGDRATAEFTQQYDSNALKETSKKALTLEKRGTAWLIAKEVSVK